MLRGSGGWHLMSSSLRRGGTVQTSRQRGRAKNKIPLMYNLLNKQCILCKNIGIILGYSWVTLTRRITLFHDVDRLLLKL